ncbi:conserved hypothetical protein [Ureaplasma parvum serovar 1 str. ATCC 27813]|uniref:DUF1410 domain-containing protein n=1 Tax=Ureaplasma parvum TaxID=134821 RepID=UPI0001722164|nr:DUF1410 domain-containing protein [Ureaplasma parvum]EDT49209.1 conserved hypothetical protein [Ureaplasma parvum serovar 1 str. ATCC 27813]
MNNKKSKKIQTIKNDNNKKNRKQRLFLLLATLNLAWAGAIIGIVLHSKNNNELSNNDFYSFNDDGDLIIKGQLPKTYINKDVYGVFVDENNQEYKIKTQIDSYAKFEFDTKYLPKTGKYKLNRIIDLNHNIVRENEKLKPQQKIEVLKPVPTNVYEDQKNEKHIQLKVNKILTNKILVAKFVNQNNEVYSIEAHVGLDQKIDIDTSSLKDGNIYYLKDLILKDSNPLTKVVNVNDIDPHLKKVDKTHTYDNEGNLVLKVDLTNKTKNQTLATAVFKDENNKKYLIPALSVKNNVGYFNTKNLPLNHKYELNRIVNNNDLNDVLVANNELMLEHKVSVNKPTKAKVNFIDNKKVYEVDLGVQLKNTPLELTLEDLNHQTYKINAKTDEKGRAVFDISSLGDNNLYEVIGIKKTNGVDVVNLKQIPYHNRSINNLNSNALNTPYQYTKNGDINLIAKVAPYYVNQQVYGIFKDQNNQEHQILAKVKKDGTITFDTGALNNNSDYSLNKIVSVSNPQNVLVSNFDLTSKQKQLIKKPAANASIDSTKKTQILENLNNDLINQKLVATFVDNNDKEYKVIANVDQNNKIIFDSNDLPKGYIYHLTKVENNDLNKVINLNDFQLKDKIIDKRDLNSLDSHPDFTYDNDGNLEIHTQLANDLNDDLKQKALNNANVKGIVVDQNGVEHEIDVSIDANGKVIIPTKNLTNNDPTKPNIYTLKKVVLKQNNQPNIDLINQEQLSRDNHISFKKPTITAKIKENDDYEISFSNPSLANKKIKLTFKTDDNNTDTKTVEATIGLDGKAIFKTSDDAIFTPDHKYTLTKIEADNKKVANIDEILPLDRIVNKQKNGNVNADNKHEFKIPDQKNKDLTAVYKDKNNNEIHVPIKTDDKGKVIVDPNNNLFDPNKIYDFDKIVDLNEYPNKTILDRNSINKDVSAINDGVNEARKLVLKTPAVSNITTNAINFQVNLFDLNKLSYNRQFALTIAKVNDLNDTQKYIATYDPKTNNYKLNFDFTHLDANTKYKVVDVELLELNNKEKPIKLVKDDVLNFEFTTSPAITINPPIWTKFDAVVKTNNDTTITFEIDDKDNILKNDQKIYAQLALMDDDLLDTDVVNPLVNFSKINKIASINGLDLKGNSKYSIKNLYYLNDQNQKVYLFKNDVTKYEQYFITNPHKINLSFNKNAVEQDIFADHANLFIDYKDHDQKLRINDDVKIYYQNIDNTKNELQIGYGKVVANNKIKFNLVGLKEKTTYVIKKLEALNKSASSIVNSEFDLLDPNTNFSTSNKNTTLMGLNSIDNWNNDQTPIINAKINIGDDFQDNQQVKLIYVSNDNKKIESKTVTLIKGQRNYQFEFSDLIKNRLYTFSKIVYETNNQELHKLNTLTHQFSINPSNNAVSLKNNANVEVTNRILVNNDQSLISAKIEVDDIDNVLTTADKPNIVYQLENSNDLDNNLKLATNAQVVVENNKKFLKFDLVSLKINQNYVIKEIRFNSKPTNAYFNFTNNKTNNIVYSYNDQTKISLSNNINPTSYKPLTINKNDKSVNIDVDLQVDKQLLANQYLRLKFKQLNDNKTVWTDPILFNNNAKISFKLSNLIHNRAYELEGLYYFDDQNSVNDMTNNQISFDSKIHKPKIEFEPSLTSIDYDTNNAIKTVSAHNAQVHFKLKTNDEALENDQIVEAVFAPSNNLNDEKVVQAKLNNVTNNFNEGELEFNLNGLKEETTYRLIKVTFKNKPNKAYELLNKNGVIFEYKNGSQAYEFTTQKFEHKVIDVVSSTSTNTTQQEITVKIDGIQRAWNNKKLELVYKSNILSDPEIKTTVDNNNNSVHLSFEKKEYNLVLNNLKPGRRYSLIKINIKEADNGQDHEFVKEINVNNSFDVNLQSEIIASNVEEINDRAPNKLNQATIKINLKDDNNILKTNDVATITYDNEQKVDAIVKTDAQNQKYLEAIITNLVFNQNVIIKKIEFKNLAQTFIKVGKNNTNVIYDESNLSKLIINNDFQIIGPLSTDANSTQNIVANNKHVISSTLDFKLNPHISKNLKFKLKFQNINGEVVYSPILTNSSIIVNNNKNVINFTLDNLKSNQLYRLVDVYYIDDNNDTINDKNKVPKANNVTRIIDIAPGKTTISKSNNTWNTTSTSSQFEFVINSDDGNEVLDNLEATISFKKGQTLLTPVKVNIIKQNNKYLIKGQITNLEPENRYVLESILLAKPNKTKKPLVVEILNKDDISFQTQAGNYKVIQIKSQNPSTVDTKQRIKLKLDGIQNAWNEKQLEITYSANDNSTKTAIIKLEKNKLEYEFELTNLEKNRTYTFTKIELINDNNTKTPFNKSHSIQDKFIVLSNNQVGVGNISEIQDRDVNYLNSAKIRFKLNDLDNVLSNDEQATITYDNNQTTSAKVITDQNQKYLEATFSNLVLNKDTIINKIEFNTKPKNASKNIGINDTNVIYDATNLIINNNLKITGPLYTLKEFEANNKTNISVSLELDTNDHISKNLYFIAKFDSNDGRSVLTSPISADKIVTNNNNKKELTFNLTNLTSNRQYTFKGLYYVNSSNQTNIDENNKFENNSNVDYKITVKPSITTIQKNDDWTFPQPNAQKFKFNINSDENVDFSTDLEATITFRDQHNTKKTITTKLKQKDNQWYIEDTISDLAYNDTYKLDDISITKPMNAFTNLKIQIENKEQISFTTQSGPTQLVSITSHDLMWNDQPNASNQQTITAKVSGVNDLYNNRKIKLVYEYRSNNQKSIVESNELTLQKDQTQYTFTLPISVANREYSFKEIKIKTANNNFETLNNSTNIANSFNVSASKTQIVIENNNNWATNITSTSATITYKLKSKDHVFRVGDSIITYLKSNDDERQQISYTKTITSVSSDGSEATVSFNTDQTLKEEANYKLTKVGFAKKPTLAHTNINNDANNVVFEDNNSNYNFKTSIVDHKVTNVSSNDSINTTTQTVNIDIDGIQRTWINKEIQLVYTANDGEEILSDQKTLLWANNHYSFELSNLKHNRKYTLKEVRIINHDNSNHQIFPLFNGISDSFIVSRSAPISIQNLTEITDRKPTALTTANIKLTINDPDNVLTNNDHVRINYDQNKIVEANVSVGNNNEKYVEVKLINLTLNKTTIINKISFNNKPNNAAQNIGDDVNNNENIIYKNENDANTWVINNDLVVSGPLSIDSNHQLEIQAINKNIVKSTLNLKINKLITKNLKLKLKFLSNNGDIIYSDLIDSSKISEENGNYVINFTLTNLKSNQSYTFNDLYFLTDPNNKDHVENQKFAKVNNVSRIINVLPGNTIITKSKDFSTNITPNSAKIKFEITSEDEGSLSNNIKATVVFKDQNDQKITPVTVNLKQISDKWIIETDINNLNPEITYKLDSISLSKPTNTVNNLKVEISNKADIKFKTAPGDFNITNINSNQPNTNVNQQNVNVNVNGIRDAWVNKKLQLVYISNTGEEIRSDEQTILKNNLSYQFNFSNLSYNRKYVFNKLIIKQSNGQIINFNNTNNINHNFIIKSKTPISIININEIASREVNKLQTAKIRFELNDSENVLSQNEEAQITYDTNKQVLGKIIVDSANNKKYLEATLNDLVLNNDSIINKIEFVTRPTNAVDFVGINNSNVVYELTNNTQDNDKLKINNDFIISNPITNNSDAIETKEYDQKNNINSSITLKANPYIIKNLQFKLRFTNQNNESVDSDWISNFTSKNNIHTINFTLTNLKSNQTYSLTNVYYFDKNSTNQQIIDSQIISKLSEFKKEFVIKPGKTTISKEGDWAEPNVNNEADFIFNITSQDGNDILENVEATVKFKNTKTQTIASTTVLITKEKDKLLIKGKISNLDPNTKYNLEGIELSKPPKTTNNLIVDILNKDNIHFTTQPSDTQLINLNIKKTTSNDLNTKTITATFSGVNDNFKDREVKLIYKDNNNQTYESNTIKLVKNQIKYDFNMSNLIFNRKYTFDSIKISQTPNNNQSFIDLAKNSITNEFTIAQSTTNIEWIQPENDEINARGAKLTFKIKTQDAILTTNTKVEAYFAPVNAINNQSQWKLFTRDLTDIDQSKNIGTWTHDLRNQTYFDEETEYVLVKIKFKDKPSLAFANINNNADNIIYQYTTTSPKYGFTTKVGDHKINSITSTSTTNNSVQNINVTLTGVKNIWLNKQMKLTYRGSDNELISSITNIVKTKTSYTFTLNNLKRNRVYHLEKVELVDNNTTTPFPKLDNITNSFIVERTEAVNVSGIEELENRNSNNLNKTVVKISLIDADNVLDANEVVNISYNNNKTVHGTVKVQNKNKYIEAVFNDLVLNEDTVIKSINFANKPSKAGENIGINKTDNKIYDNVINTNKPLIINNNFKLVGPTVNTQITKEANQKTNITFDLDVNINPKIANTLRFKAKFRATNGEFVETNIVSGSSITTVNSKQKINFNLTNLKTNQIYTLTELYYLPNSNNNIVDTNKVKKDANVSRTILVNKGSTIISKYGEWNQIGDTTAQFNFLINSEDNNNELKNDAIATIKFKDNKNNIKTTTVNLTKEQNQWLIKGLLTQLNPETEYHLETISITKPSNLVQDLDISIPTKTSIKFTTQSGPTILNSLNVDSNAISTDTQTIKAVFSGVNSEYHNRQVKLIYKDNNNKIYETNTITLSKNTKNYNFILNDLTANRNYVFDKVQINNAPNSINYIDLKKLDGLTNSFKRKPSVTSIEWNQPTNVTDNSSTLNIKLKSVDKVFDTNQQVIVYITKTNGETLKWTRNISHVNNEKTEATINVETGETLNEQTEYKLLKVEFVQKPNLAFENLNSNNTITNTNNNAKFTTIPGPTRLISVTSASLNNMTQEINVTVSGVNDDYVGRKIKLAYKDNNNNIVWTNEVPLEQKNKKNYEFIISNGLNTNREYTLYEAKITNAKNSSTFINLSTNSITHKFAINPGSTNLVINRGSFASNITENSATITVNITSTDAAFENNQEVEARFESIENPSETKVFNGVLTNVSNDKNNATITWNLQGLKAQTEYKFIFAKFKTKPHLAKWELTPNKNNVVFGGTPEFKFRTMFKKPRLIKLESHNIDFNLANLLMPNKELGKIKATISDFNDSYLNKKIRLIYESNDHKEWSTNELVLSKNKVEYEFDVKNITSNRKYSFRRIEIYNNKFEVLDNVNNVTDEFIYYNAPTTITIPEDLASNISSNNATFKLGLNSFDKILEDNQAISVVLANKNYPNDTSKYKTYTTFVSQTRDDGMHANIVHELNNLDEHSTYFIKEVKFINKPNKIIEHPNWNNKIFDSTKSSKTYEFTTKWANYNAEKKEPWNDTTRNSAEFKFKLTTSGIMLNTNTHFKITFRKDNDQNHQEKIYTGNLSLEGNEWILKGKYENLDPNSTYTLDSIKLSVNNNFENDSVNVQIANKDQIKIKTKIDEPVIQRITYDTNNKAITRKIKLEINNIDSSENGDQILLEYTYDNGTRSRMTSALTLDNNKKDYEVTINNLTYNREYTLKNIIKIKNGVPKVLNISNSINKKFVVDPSITKVSNFKNDKYEINYANLTFTRTLEFDINNSDEWFIPTKIQSYKPRSLIWNISNNSRFNDDRIETKIIYIDNKPKIQIKMKNLSLNEFNQKYQIRSIYFSGKVNDNLNQLLNNQLENAVYLWNSRFQYLHEEQYFIEGTGDIKGVLELNSTDNGFGADNNRQYNYVKFNGLLKDLQKFSPQGNNNQTIFAKLLFVNLNNNKLYQTGLGIIKDDNKVNNYDDSSNFIVPANEWPRGRYQLYGLKYWSNTGNYNENNAKIALIPLEKRSSKVWDRS